STRSMANDSDQFLATQIKLIQSDGVLRPVAQRYNLLDIEAQTGETHVSRSAAEEAPVLLKDLKVTRPVNTYLLLISYRSTDPRLAADVSNAIARSYLEHTYNIRFKSSASLSAFMERQLEELKAKMERSGGAPPQIGVSDCGSATSVGASQGEHRAAGGSGIPRGHQPRVHAGHGGRRDQEGVRHAERALVRVPGQEA